MSQQPVLLQLPEELYERVRQIAEESHRPVENVLMDGLKLMFGDLTESPQLTPNQLTTFSDDQLWALVHRPFSWTQDVRLRELTELGKISKLSEEEQSEMERLIDAVDHYVLLRSQALLLLKQRGHDVERRLKLGA